MFEGNRRYLFAGLLFALFVTLFSPHLLDLWYYDRRGFFEFALKMFTPVAVVVGMYLGWRRLELGERGHVTDRFTKAIEQLGNEAAAVRVGGIYSLTRLLQETTSDLAILPILQTFARQHEDISLIELEAINRAHLVGKSRLNFSGKSLPEDSRNGSLEGISLQNSDLVGAGLNGAILIGSDLSGANLNSASLADADLTDADLTGANLHGANLSGAKLKDANLERSKLSDANLKDANLNHANLSDAFLRGAILQGTYLEGADLTHVSFGNADLTGADLAGVNLKDADFRLANLSDAFLPSARNLPDLSFTFGNSATELPPNILRPDHWDRPDSEQRGTIAKLVHQTPGDIDLRSAGFNEADLFRANLKGANLQGANLERANLSKANLIGADLRGANLNEADLFRANLTEANLNGADLREADLREAKNLSDLSPTVGDDETQLPPNTPRPEHWGKPIDEQRTIVAALLKEREDG